MGWEALVFLAKKMQPAGLQFPRTCRDGLYMEMLRRVTTSDRDPGAPTREQQAQMLYNLWLLDIPKLMDVAVLYGAHNPELTRKFLIQVFDLQPRYSDDLVASAPLLVGNLAEVVGRCMAAGDRALKVGSAAAAAHVKELRGEA
ncbi:hypothetical protein Vretimale_8004 [Volvox reticuliferus]|uniref:Uncharacterized protein n=1 Tax=Volvox reticuliferus TaxID=1737510 RepID=A0A8J4GAF5_9CHLO|nr:hypothetical protein Vretimale_8004 [Volvox reticuliferus]